MENSTLNSTASVSERKVGRRKDKAKPRQPMKVVYISNPMKFKTSASEFRALVQELTGQDAELPDPTKHTDSSDDDVGGNPALVDVVPAAPTKAEAPSSGDPCRPMLPDGGSHQTRSGGGPASSAGQSFHDDDNPFLPPVMMVDNLSWYDSAHFDVPGSPYAM